MAALVCAGAIAGFFYAYSSSVMGGLDAAAPQAALIAMQGINATVRNPSFAPAFFGTPVAALAAGLGFMALRQKRAGRLLLLASATYVCGAMAPTFLVNVAMNDALAGLSIPADPREAARLWSDYSLRWTWWNSLRMLFSMLSLLLVGLALFVAGLDASRLRRP
ncbi:DUF1772 domain-containing protein [Phreatobacter stygius]|uniref:DUF1772 domain-containing protein n=2 Tax=Phreatobacter stygius TaxID=1940610 RepID=A0A4D7BE14_9HYPH|nr:DUF1772 domain-containing protein [Phreatobacter stygius]